MTTTTPARFVHGQRAAADTPAPFTELVTGAADGAFGSLDVAGLQTSFGPLGQIAGSAPPAFTKTQKVAEFKHGYNLDPKDKNHLNLQVETKTLADTVESSGLGVDAIGIQATSDLASGTVILVDNLLSTLSVLGLSVSATLIHSDSDASYVFGPDKGFLSGGASFGSLTVSGALIGKTLTFKGHAAANTVLFHSSAVTITLDKQTRSDFLPPGPPSPAGPNPSAPGPNQITTDALNITLTNATIFGKTISGTIVLGETSASLFPPLST